MTYEQSLLSLQALSYLYFCRVQFTDVNILAAESVHNILNLMGLENGVKMIWENMPKPKFFYDNFPELSTNYKTVSKIFTILTP